MSTELEIPAGEDHAIAAARPASSLQSMIEEVLLDQHRLQTPVARFAAHHEQGRTPGSSVLASLIPLSAPSPGEQYAFEVDLDACSGCKACVAGCHSLNGLDENETWRDVGLVLGGDAMHPFQQTITSACHHCEDPACLNGCPVLAYDKDPVTGIVRHLDDQCIGCSYCILKCPYDVPKFSKRLGIVRKCDMCHGRLAEGEAPACAQSCPTHAIRITKVARVRDGAVSPVSSPGERPSTFLPVFSDPRYTVPTTRYISKRRLPGDLRAADASTIRAQPLHAPLVLMLVLTQASVGAAVAYAVASPRFALPFAVVTGVLGIGASMAHLGQPLRAWRVFLGLRRSWLSREAVLFGAYLPALLLAWLGTWMHAKPAALDSTVPFAAAAVGTLSILCSMMIYIDTRRRFWRPFHTSLRMAGTVSVVALAWTGPTAAAVALGAKLIGESFSLPGRSVTARLQRGPLRTLVIVRNVLGLAAVACFPVAAPIALSLALLGEFAERALYFRAVDAPKMPGSPG